MTTTFGDAAWQDVHPQFTDRASDSGLAETVESPAPELAPAFISEAHTIVGEPARKAFRIGSNAEHPTHQTVISPVIARVRMRSGPARRAIPEA